MGKILKERRKEFCPGRMRKTIKKNRSVVSISCNVF